MDSHPIFSLQSSFDSPLKLSSISRKSSYDYSATQIALEGDILLKKEKDDWKKVRGKILNNGFLHYFGLDGEKETELLGEIDLVNITFFEFPITPTYKKNCFELHLEHDSQKCIMISTQSENSKRDWFAKIQEMNASAQSRRASVEDTQLVKDFKMMMKLSSEEMAEEKQDFLSLRRMSRASSLYITNSLEGDLQTNASNILDEVAHFIELYSKCLSEEGSSVNTEQKLLHRELLRK